MPKFSALTLALTVIGLLLFVQITRVKALNTISTTDSIALSIPASQTRSTENIAKYISTHFNADEDKVRAAFIWVATTFRYDVANMYQQNAKETPQDKIKKALTTHQGVCEHYALVFNDVCSKLGITSYMITGYTRKYGQTSFLPHAWCCVKTNGSWLLYDPTWASGYVQNGKFVPRINEAFYKVDPQKMISTHMAFDPMWELLHYPITNDEFRDSIVTEKRQKPFFNYDDSIAAWQRQPEQQKLEGTAQRIVRNGLTNALAQNELNRINQNLEFFNANKYNASVADFNIAVKWLNTFIEYRNHQFKPAKADNTIKAMLDSADKRLTVAREKIAGVKSMGNINDKVLATYQKLNNDFATKLDAQKAFLVKYFTRDKEGRKSMFEE